MFNSKVILITGGTGSFGKAFINNLFKSYKPKKVIVFSRDELKQYEIHNNLINKGVSGETTPEMLNRFDADVLNLAPEAVIILAGINDIAQNTGYISISETFNNIALMVDLAKKNNIKPVLCSVLPANELTSRPEIKPAELVIEHNQKLSAYCEKNNLVYIDYFSSMVGGSKELRSELTYDGIHPDKKGYIIMEQILLETISKIF